MMTLASYFHAFEAWGLLALRLAIGVIFLYHCRSKLGGRDAFMRFIGYAELAGGTAMVLGILTELAALGLGIIMIGAIYKKTQKWHVPFASHDKLGWEFDLLILGGCLAQFTLGGGDLALEWMLFGVY